MIEGRTDDVRPNLPQPTTCRWAQAAPGGAGDRRTGFRFSVFPFWARARLRRRGVRVATEIIDVVLTHQASRSI